MNKITPDIAKAMFQPAERKGLNVLIMIGGTSSSGKTYSAMQLATGLSGKDKNGKPVPFAVIDTEAGRAKHYAMNAAGVGFRFDHMHFGVSEEGEGFTPERYAEAVEAAAAAGYRAVIVDSFSHEWEGIGGVLEIQDEEIHKLSGGDPARMEKMRMKSWMEPKRRHRAMFQRILQCDIHVIFCVRAKEIPDNLARDSRRKSKIRRNDIPLDFACGKDDIFEMTTVLLLETGSKGVPIHIKVSDEHSAYFPHGEQLSEKTGAALAKWCEGGGVSEDTKALLTEARAVAHRGKEAFRAFWADLSRDQRATLRPIMPELQETAESAIADDDDPFGDDPSSSGPGALAQEPAPLVSTGTGIPDGDPALTLLSSIGRMLSEADSPQAVDDVVDDWHAQVQPQKERADVGPKFDAVLSQMIEARKAELAYAAA